MNFCYILYSKTLNQFYIGATHDGIDSRIEKHNTGYYDNSYTKKATDWILFHSIECESYSQATQIEKHIKKMKSKKYIENIYKYPEMSEKLKGLYST